MAVNNPSYKDLKHRYIIYFFYLNHIIVIFKLANETIF